MQRLGYTPTKPLGRISMSVPVFITYKRISLVFSCKLIWCVKNDYLSMITAALRKKGNSNCIL